MVYLPATRYRRHPSRRATIARNALLVDLAVYAGAGVALVALCAGVLAVLMLLDAASADACVWGARLCR